MRTGPADRAAQVLVRVPVGHLRWRAALPRRALLAAALVLSLLGVRALLVGTPAPPPPPREPADAAATDPVEGFAEAFARAYLSHDGRDPERRAASLAGFLGADLDADAGLAGPPRGRSVVTWTAAAGRTPLGGGREVVTVTAALASRRGLLWLAVPVARGAGGALAVTDYPAFVGPPARAARMRAASGDDVADAALRAVAERALANYLSGAQDNLRADLAPGVPPPAPPLPALELSDVQALAWLAPGRVAATVLARDRTGVSYTLRYRLTVVKRDRWYVRALHTTITPKGDPR
jgi:hypothetical protein